jgi:hypothetical protein
MRTNAIPLAAGRASKNFLKVSRPPAEAPSATTGKSIIASLAASRTPPRGRTGVAGGALPLIIDLAFTRACFHCGNSQAIQNVSCSSRTSEQYIAHHCLAQRGVKRLIGRAARQLHHRYFPRLDGMLPREVYSCTFRFPPDGTWAAHPFPRSVASAHEFAQARPKRCIRILSGPDAAHF